MPAMSLTVPDLPPPGTPRWQGLAPVADARTRALVLGSFPGLRSLQQQQYYAHPQNQFWPLLQALWPEYPQPGRDDYAGRCEWLLARGLGLWDVYASCEREGSLDSAIVRGSEVPNPIGDWLTTHPQVAAIALNGGKAADAFRRHIRPTLPDDTAPATFALPSTSPAHAAMGLPALVDAWRVIAPFLRTTV